MSRLLAQALLLMIAGGLMVACAQGAVRLYDGDERAADSVAIVTLPEALEVEQINGARVSGASGPLRKGDIDLQLAPGRYELLVYYKEIWSLGDAEDALRSDPARFVIEARAGHRYRIEYAHPERYEDAKALTAEFSGWIEDAATGERVQSENSGLQFKRGLTAQLSGDRELIQVAEKSEGRHVVAPMPEPASAVAAEVVSKDDVTAAAPAAGDWLPVMKGWWAQATPSERRAFLLWVGEQTGAVPSQP